MILKNDLVYFIDEKTGLAYQGKVRELEDIILDGKLDKVLTIFYTSQKNNTSITKQLESKCGLTLSNLFRYLEANLKLYEGEI